jgi:thiol:disulfide interchange protein DsbA
MQAASRILAAFLLVTLAACGQGGDRSASPPAAETAAATTTETTADVPQEAATEAAQPVKPAPADTAPGTDEAPAAVAESASPQEAPASNLGKEIELAKPAAQAPAEWKFRDGAHYRTLPAAQGTSSSPDKIEVAEVFWYGCPHCYDLEPVIEDWARRQADDVSFVRIPVMWSPGHEIHARLFYTAQALGKLDEIHPAVFRAFHIERNLLQDEDEIRKLFGKFGVSAEEFNKTFRSFAVESQLQRARAFMTRYRVKAVPLLVVNGKYVIDGPEIKSRDQQLAVVDELVLRERLKQ